MYKRHGPMGFRTKLLGIIVAITTIVALVPALALPVGAQNPPPALVPAEAFNVAGAIERFHVTNYAGNVTWNVFDVIPGTGAQIVASDTSGADNFADVQAGGAGEATISATILVGDQIVTLYAEKKWVQIEYTTISDPQTVPVQWDEPSKTWSASVDVWDKVWGNFVNKDGLVFPPTGLGGAVLHWYLVPASYPVPPLCGITSDLLPILDALPRPLHVKFANDGTHMTTTSGDDGKSTVTVSACAEEAVKVVVLATYPTPINVPVCIEVTSINFWTTEWEKVPQVAWAGDKVVLEKNFGTPCALVRFSLENQSPGTLEGIGAGIANLTNTTQTVWTLTNENGVASVIVHSQDPGEVDVLATLWAFEDGIISEIAFGPPDNEHAFVVYYLKFEDVVLTNVVGKRAGHNSGLWTPPNPWDSSTDVLAETLNVSQDALLRIRVRGYFENAQTSTRPARTIVNGPTSVILPAGRWILPDDWAALAGPDWQELRIHWDIMDAPNDTVVSSNPFGPYNSADGLTATPVIGPFSPGLELMTPTGWDVGSLSPERQYKTVVPNGALDRWDAPMPPAKIIVKINEGPGFFKAVNKADVYYTISGGSIISYTNPFYATFIPAHPAIPAFVNNGGYDWSSFGNPPPEYGPYCFWTIINQPSQGAPVASYGPILPTKNAAGQVINPGVPIADWAGHPTKVEVYSDNHGEAMVYLNGYWNMNLSPWITNGAYDVPPGATIGSTTVEALADYPYFRKHEAMLSNTVVKTWTWGKQIMGATPGAYPGGAQDRADSRMVIQTGTFDPGTFTGTFPNETALSDKKMAWIWITNPDGFPAVGEKIDWTIEQASGSGANIPDISGIGVSVYNDITKSIALEHGFLAGTGGYTLNATRTIGRSWTRLPTAWEKQLFLKFWPDLDPDDYAVAAVEVYSSLDVLVDLSIFIDEGILGTMIRHTILDFAVADPCDDEPVMGDANQDGVINMGDVTTVERMILGLCPATSNITYHMPLDMGAVIKIERQILGK